MAKEEEIIETIGNYIKQKSNYENYCVFLKGWFKKILKTSNINIAGLQARVKKEESLKLTLEKRVKEGEEHDQKYEPKLNGIQDLIGFRVIFYSDGNLLQFEQFLDNQIHESRLNRYQKYDE